MKVASVVLATTLALALQTVMAGASAVDFVLIVVVYAALVFGPVTGLFTGAFAGLVQDVLASGVVGIGGVAKTVVGFAVGLVGTQFIVTQPLPRFVVFVGATLVHAVVFYGLYMVLPVGPVRPAYAAIATQALTNALVGVVTFQMAELLPGVLERRRAARGRIRR